jgi:hypothetical protein
VPYKRIDIAVEAFNRLGRRLIIVGEGPDLGRLASRARASITFTERVSDAQVADLMARARGFILPGEEDFGIAAVEAQAAGTPVIALGRGGALDSVISIGDDPAAGTGLFFNEPTAAALVRAVERFERTEFAADALRRNAERFQTAAFLERMRERVDAVLEGDVEPCASRR